MKQRQHVYIDMDIVDSVRAKAKEIGMSYSELVDLSLRYYLYKHEELNKPDAGGGYTIGRVLERLIMENKLPISKVPAGYLREDPTED